MTAQFQAAPNLDTKPVRSSGTAFEEIVADLRDERDGAEPAFQSGSWQDFQATATRRRDALPKALDDELGVTTQPYAPEVDVPEKVAPLPDLGRSQLDLL
jgi:hypothetical protein